MDWHVIEARILYLAPAEGGRRSGVASGYRGQFYYDGDDFDGFQYFPDLEPGVFIELGREVRTFVRFELERWDLIHQSKITEGMLFEIREGNRTVGRGVVTSIDVDVEKWPDYLDR